jgi:hypothetical protein
MKKYLLNNTCNHMKTYTISKKKIKEKKTEVKSLNVFLSLKMKFFCPENDRIA